MLVVLTQRDKHVDSPAPADLYDIGTVSMVHRVMKTPEGNLFVIVDASGKEVSLRLSPQTMIQGKAKVGDWIRVEFTPDRTAVSIAPAKIMRGVQGG